MISPLSSVGKTMLSSLEGAIGRGMPIDQAITYVKSMAQQGVAPLVDLYALLKQFERMKQQPTQAPMGGNLKQQLDNLESSIVRSPGGITGRPMSAAPMAGIASLDAGRMENPQEFNSGGIVAFDQGGTAEDKPKSIAPELYTLPTSLEDLARQQMAKEAALRTPEGRAKFEAELDADMKARGLGKYAQSLGMREAFAERKTKEAEALGGEEAALNEESFWADVAGTDQPDLISAMAKSKAKAVERKRTSKEKVSAAKDKAEDLRILRQEAREALARGDYDEYKKKLTAAETLSQTSVKEYVTEKEADEDARLAAERARQLARIQKDSPLVRAQEKLANTPRYLENGEPNPEYGETKQLIADLYSGKGGRSRADVAFYKDIYGKAEIDLRKAKENNEIYGTPETAAALAAAQKARDTAKRNYESAALGQEAPAASSTMPTDFSQISDEQLLSLLGQ